MPSVEPDQGLRDELEILSNEELVREIETKDPERAANLDPKNRRRLIRALEIIRTKGSVPARPRLQPVTHWLPR